MEEQPVEYRGVTMYDMHMRIEEVVSEDVAGLRLDVYLAGAIEDASRSFVKKLIKDAKVSVNGKSWTRPGRTMSAGDRVEVEMPPPASTHLGPEDIHLGRREAIKDVARVLSRYLDIMVYRTFAHNRVEEFSKYSNVPVINGLSDFSHPCQALTDFFTIEEKLGSLRNLKLAYVGDANNVFASLLALSVKMGITFSYATPEEYAPDEKNIKQKRELAIQTGAKVEGFFQPEEAVKNADVVYTDVWISMGQEDNAVEKRKKFANYQVSLPLLKKAKPNVLFMHCLPARRGEEITDEVLESRHSIVFDQAENRMHVQKALLLKLLGK